MLTQTQARIWRIAMLAGLAIVILLSLWLVDYYRSLQYLALPLALLLAMLLLYNYKPLFFLMIATIPFSIAFEFGNTSIDMFSEPLMLLFLLIFIIRTLAGKQFSPKNKIYPFHIFIFLLLFWTAFTTLLSDYPLRSAKFLLAKIWYLTAFVYMAEHIISNMKSVQRIFWAFFIPLMLVIIYITSMHALEGFSFESSHNIVIPLFPNAVIYGATLALFLPFVWYARSWYTPKSFEWYICWLGMGLIMIGILLSFKRGAWLAVALLPIAAMAVKRKWLEKLVYATLLIAALGLSYLIKDNNFYQFAPNYEQTIWHEGNIRGHLQATFTGKEISGVERFYRWVAAKNMIEARPFTGFGPSTFNQVYKHYADDAFRTYVSDNPEQSTTHNYFLMTFTEQGLIGGLLFMGLCIFMLIKASRLYHQVSDPKWKILLLTLILSLLSIIFHSLLNELIEVDKVGTMFWLILLMIHKIQTWHEKRPQRT